MTPLSLNPRRAQSGALAFALAVAVAVAGAPAAQAKDFFYALSVPTYDINQDPATFGSAADVFVELSNGGATNSGQTYTYQDVIALGVTTNGAFNIPAYQPVTYTGSTITDVFGTTNALGQLSLNQPTSNAPIPNPDGFTASNPGDTYAIKWYLWAYDYTTHLPIYYFKWSDVFSTNTASGVVGNVVAVPEPATWMMMLVGFGALGVAMRLRRKPKAASI
jgi:hypothetical protein